MKKHFGLFILILQFLTINAQNKYSIHKLSSVNELSSNIVYDIAQDNDGFLWFATHDGLNRYDGYTFRTFKYLAGDSSSISGNYNQSICIDSEGYLWISTRYG